jgi:protein-disulfide isomerase
LRFTRRQFPGIIASLLAAWPTLLDGLEPAAAQTIPQAELMKAGPLGEESLGSDRAPVTIIEYASLTCPHCAHFAEATFPQLKKDFIDTGKARYIFREFPFDPLAAAAFMLTRCAPHDQYFSIIALLFRTQDQWLVPAPIKPLQAVLKPAGFTSNSFKACLANEKILSGIDQVRDRAAREFGVDATPTFFINGRKYTGDMSIEQLEQAMRPYLMS